MKLKHLQRVWLVKIKKFLNRNFNPYYRDIKYLANVNEIVKELRIFETRLIKDHNVLLERNRCLVKEREELELRIKEYLKSHDEYKDMEFGKITIFTDKRLKESDDIYNKTLLAYSRKGEKKLLALDDNIEYNIRFMLYSLCLVNCDLVKTNVYYKFNNKLLPLSDFFKTLILDLNSEYKDQPLLVDPNRFFKVYSELYPNYLFKHILNVSNFEQM